MTGKAEDLQLLEDKLVQYFGKKKTWATVEVFPPEEPSDKEAVSIELDIVEKVPIHMRCIIDREKIQGVRPRAQVIEIIGGRVADARKRVKEEEEEE